MPFCYLNGKVLPVAEAKVSVHDIGLLRGYGIYEALTTYGRVPFELPAHLARLRRSAEAMRLTIPESDEAIADVLKELIGRNIGQGKEAVARFILTGGKAIGGIEYDPRTPTFYILVEELQPLPREAYEKGTRVLVHEHLRIFPEYKTTNYITAVMLQEERKRAEAVEILYTYRGQVLECATSNFFIVKSGAVITPQADVLGGITRQVALELARKEFPAEERPVSVDEMYAADEAFLTSSFKGIVPVVEIGDKRVGAGMPGPVTKRLMQLFDELTRRLA